MEAAIGSIMGRKERSMSSVGGIGGVGGAAGHISRPGSAGGNVSPQAITPSKGAEGISDDGGKNSLTIGDGNLIGNTQTQTVNNNITTINYMSTKDFCSLHNASSTSAGEALQGISEMSGQELQKMLAALLIMKLIQQLFEQAQEMYGEGGSAAGVGSASSMNASAGGGEAAASSGGSGAGGSSGGSSSGHSG